MIASQQDLNFSPVTNLLPIRRCNLAVGATAAVTATWLRFPDLDLIPLDQIDQRTDQLHYHYASGSSSFVADLMVNAAGFVIDYPKLWRAMGE